MIENYVRNHKGEKVKSYGPVLIGIENVNILQGVLIPLLCLANFLSFHMGKWKTSTHTGWRQKFNQIFPSQNNSPSPSNYVFRVTEFNLVVTHNPGKGNAAADFLSRLQSNSKETIELKLRENPNQRNWCRCTSKATRQHNQWALCRQFTCWPTPSSRNTHIDNPQTIGNLWSGSEPTKEFDIKQGTTPDEIQQENNRNERHSTHKPTGWLARIGNNNG